MPKGARWASVRPLEGVLQLLAWIGFGLFCLSSLVVGSKLLRLWWRTRELPELLGGVSLLSMGPLGFVPTMLSSHLGTAVGDRHGLP